MYCISVLFTRIAQHVCVFYTLTTRWRNNLDNTTYHYDLGLHGHIMVNVNLLYMRLYLKKLICSVELKEYLEF